MFEALIIAGTVVAGVLFRRFVLGRAGGDQQGDAVSTSDFVTALSTVAILLLAFIMVAAFETWKDAATVSGTEADQVVKMARHASFLPDGTGGEVVGELVCYARSVERLDWSAMRDRRASLVTEEWLDGLSRHVENHEDVEGIQQYVEMQAALIADRRQRLAAALPSVPNGMTWFMVVTVLLTVFGLTVYTEINRSHPGHAVLLFTSVVILAGSLMLTRDLDHPYEGTLRQEPSAMRHAAKDLDEEAEHHDVEAPCDDRGVPDSGGRDVRTEPIA
jgi:Protein of unknown function (DUF4239)